MYKKPILIISGVLLFGIILLLAFLPSMIVSYVEGHDRELIGREITIGDIDIDYFGGSTSILDFKIYQSEGDSVFFGAESMFIDFELFKLLSKNLHITSFQLHGWNTRIIQNGNEFNFDDIIKTIQESSSSKEPQETGSNFHFQIENVEVSQGQIDYSSILYPLLSVTDIEFKLPFFSDTSRALNFQASSNLSTGGEVQMNGGIQLVDSVFNLDLKTIDVDLSVIEPYLRPVINFKELNGLYNSELLISGSLVDPDVLNLSGEIKASDFELIDDLSQSLIFAKDFQLSIDTVDFKKANYTINTFKTSGVDVNFEMWADSNSFSRIIRKDSSERLGKEVIESENPFVLIYLHVKDIVKSYDKTNYSLNQFLVEDVKFHFEDHSLRSGEFDFQLTEGSLKADSIKSDEDRFKVDFKAILSNNASLTGNMTPSVKNPQDFELYLQLDQLDLQAFSPYTLDYVGYPINSGGLTYKCRLDIRSRRLNSMNLINLENLTWGEKGQLKAEYNLPVKTATSLLKSPNGMIALDIPIKGNLKDPNFKIGKVVWKIVKNLTYDPLSSPYTLFKKIEE